VIPISISFEPQHGGRHLFEHAAGGDEDAFGLAVPAGENLDHVHAIKREVPGGGDGLDRKALAAAGNAHHQEALGHDLLGHAVAQMEELPALHQPLLEVVETPDFAEVRIRGNVLDHAAAVDQQTLFLEQGRQRIHP
jgi:hypothetical protein